METSRSVYIMILSQSVHYLTENIECYSAGNYFGSIDFMLDTDCCPNSSLNEISNRKCKDQINLVHYDEKKPILNNVCKNYNINPSPIDEESNLEKGERISGTIDVRNNKELPLDIEENQNFTSKRIKLSDQTLEYQPRLDLDLSTKFSDRGSDTIKSEKYEEARVEANKHQIDQKSRVKNKNQRKGTSLRSESKDEPKDKKETNKNKIGKNYIGIISRGFANKFLTSEYHIILKNNVVRLIGQSKYIVLLKMYKLELIIEMIQAFVSTYVGGKIYYESQNKKKVSDSKVSSKKSIQLVFHPHTKDDLLTLLCKEVLRNILEYFFDCANYKSFLAHDCGAQSSNKVFLLENRESIQQAFLEPWRRTKFC